MASRKDNSCSSEKPAADMPRVDDRFRAEFLRNVKPPYRDRYQSIVDALEKVCLEYCEPLDQEYLAVTMLLAVNCCQKGTPVVEGRAKPESWAAGIFWTVGMVNFLDDKSTKPHLSSAAAARAFGVSQATLQAKSREIREGLDIQSLDPNYTLPSMMIHNPLVWMLETEEGFIVDARDLPVEVQQVAYEDGLIPFVCDPDHGFGSGMKIIPRGVVDQLAEDGELDEEESGEETGEFDAGVFRIFD